MCKAEVTEPPENPPFRVSDLCRLMEAYLPPDQVREIYGAYLFGAEAHDGQVRQSGEAYISHPVAVAGILAEMQLDKATLEAALLHDVIEDTECNKARITELFGAQVAELVDGVSKLKHIKTADEEASGANSKAELKAASLQKMLMAMIQDVRVILVKLADRLHNMRTLGAKKPGSRRRIGRETLEIYAPIATRLGMGKIALELENLSFAALHPWRSRVIIHHLQKNRERQREKAETILTSLRTRLAEAEIEAEVLFRDKHLYRVYSRIRDKHIGFKKHQRQNIGVRIIVDKPDTCYRVLGIVHSLYQPKPGRFKDYIAIPKTNYYQSLHTDVLSAIEGINDIAVQIRTEDMHQFAEYGITSYSLYRSCGEENSSPRHAGNWFRNLRDMQRSAGSPLEFVENVKRDLFPDEVYVLTPKGEIIELPRNATVVDFAYTVHSDVGQRLIAARIDGELVSLDTVLRTGQRVEAITANWASPKIEWLDFVVSGRARGHIRNFLKNLQREKAVNLGQRILDRELNRYGWSVESLSEAQRNALLSTFKFKQLGDLLADIGLGNHLAYAVARQLVDDSDAADKDLQSQDGGAENAPPSAKKPLIIKGTEGMLISLAKCCHPIPGDAIRGHVSPGKGIVVHRQACPNATRHQQATENWLELRWEEQVDARFPVEIGIELHNQMGALATISAALANLEINIEHVNTSQKDGINTVLWLVIQVQNRIHLATIMRHLRRLKAVTRIVRR